MFGGCKEPPYVPPEGEKGDNPITQTTILSGIDDSADIAKFAAEVDNTDGSHYNGAVSPGIVNSPYFLLKADGIEVPVYSVRTSIGAHSYAQLDANDDAFPIDLELTLSFSFQKIIVLPEKAGVSLGVKDNVVKSRITKRGSYSFVPDDDPKRSFTLLVRDILGQYEAPEGYEVIKVEPGTHTRTAVRFTDSRQVLYFKAGVHKLHYIEFFSDTVLYLERGAILYALPPSALEETPTIPVDWAGMTRWRAMFVAENKRNISILGRGTVDFSAVEWHSRSPLSFISCENVNIDGLTLNNATEWNMTLALCKTIDIRNVAMFGYRQNSDGIAIVDSADALIEDCFGRLGDDVFEVKSMYGNASLKIENITFRRCDAWPDKARGFGIIHETQRDICNVSFIDCSVGFASARWMDALGALVIIVANNAEITDIVFEDIEIYYNNKYPINITMYDSSNGLVENVYFKNINYKKGNEVRIANYSMLSGIVRDIWFDDIYISGKRAERFIGSNGLALYLSNINRDEVVKLNQNP